MGKCKYILLIVLALIVVGCASSRRTSSTKQPISLKAKVCIGLNKHTFDANCVVKVWKNELIVLSVVPLLGIEMFRIEATPECITIFDKLNRRYAIMHYEELNKLLPIHLSFRLLQLMTKKIDKEIEFATNIKGHDIRIQASLSHRETSKGTPTPLNRSKYKQVNVLDILPI